MIFSAGFVSMPAGGSSMLTWMFHRFVSLRVVCNNISIIHILLISSSLTSAMLSISLTMLSVSYWVTLCRESQVKLAWWVAVSSLTSHSGLVRTLHSAGRVQSDSEIELWSLTLDYYNTIYVQYIHYTLYNIPIQINIYKNKIHYLILHSITFGCS